MEFMQLHPLRTRVNGFTNKRAQLWFDGIHAASSPSKIVTHTVPQNGQHPRRTKVSFTCPNNTASSRLSDMPHTGHSRSSNEPSAATPPDGPDLPRRRQPSIPLKHLVGYFLNKVPDPSPPLQSPLLPPTPQPFGQNAADAPTHSLFLLWSTPIILPRPRRTKESTGVSFPPS